MNTPTITISLAGLDSLDGLLPAVLSVTQEVIPLADIKRDVSLWFDPLDASTPVLPLIQPLLVQKKGDGYTIIDGYKRFAQLEESSETHGACMVVSTSLSAKESGLVRAALNNSRSFTTSEQVQFALWLQRNQMESSQFDRALGLTGVNAKRARALRKISTASDSAVQAFVDGHLALEHAPDFLCLSPEDQQAFLSFFDGLGLSVQSQREFLQWLPEIAYAQATSLAELLRHSQVKAARETGSLTPNQRIEKIRSVLFAIRFPRFAETRDRWNQAARAANPNPASVTFAPSPAFEKKRLDITIRVNDAHSATRLFSRLAAVDESLWSSLIDPIE